MRTSERLASSLAASRACLAASSSSRSLAAVPSGSGGGGGAGCPLSMVASGSATGGASWCVRSAILASHAASAPGVAVCDLWSYDHRTPASAAVSIGSPRRSADWSSIAMREWQPAMTTAASLDAADTSTSLITPTELASAASPALPALPSSAVPRVPSELPLTMPTGTSLSVVRVPVLSKSTASILPAVGTRYGSVHMTPAFISAISAVFTARAVCIGRWRGTTDVTMMTHLRSSSCVVRSPFSSPFLNTKPLAISAKMSRMKSASRVSLESSPTFCCENSIIIISSPWAERKPERST